MSKPINRCRTLLLSLLFALLCLPAPLLASPAGLPAAKAAFERGEYPAALDLLQQLLQQHPGDPELDFLLGRSAYESGDYETAVFAYERVLLQQPEADRVRLELARSYFAIGNLVAARSNLQQVLAKQPPPAVQQNIESFLRKIDAAEQQHHFSGYLSTALTYDSNVRAAPVEDQFLVGGGTLTLNGPNATPQKDLVSQNSFRLDHLYQRHPTASVAWQSSLLLYKSIYREAKDLDLQLFGISSGPVWQWGRQRTRLQAGFDNMALGGDRYLSILSLGLEHSWAASELFSYGIKVQLAELNYAVDARDAERYRLELTHLTSWRASRFLAAFGVEQNSARDNQFSYLRKFLSLRYERQLPWQLTASLGYRLQISDYQGETPFFNRERKDQLRELNLGFSRPLWRSRSGPRQLLATLSGTLTDTLSNIEMYQYDREQVSFSLTYLF